MDYRHQIADFVERTLDNLAQIEQRSAEQEHFAEPFQTAFPVTQLVNSLLGLVVFPKEKYESHIPEVSLDDLRLKGRWPAMQVDHPVEDCCRKDGSVRRQHEQTCKSLRDVLRVLRHGVAHFNVTTAVDQHGWDIGKLRFANRCLSCGEEMTAVTMTVDELRSAVFSLGELIVEHAERQDGYIRRRGRV